MAPVIPSPINGGRPIDTIIVHCSDSPDDRVSVRAAEIDRWHKERGFKMIGYHWVICKDGIIETGRPLETIGAHCKGHNLFSVGICWVGRNDCNPKQRRALIVLITEMMAKFKLQTSAVKGHKEFDSNKTCPNLDMDLLRHEIDLYLKGQL